MKSEVVLVLILLFAVMSCAKDDNSQHGYYSIKTLTNNLDVAVKVEIGSMSKNIYDTSDIKKYLIYRTIIQLQPKLTATIDSVFVCTKNSKTLLNQIDLQREPLLFRLSFDNKTKIDTNCGHIYTQIGLIKNCQNDKKNYFNQQYWTSTKDKSGNNINNYSIDNSDLVEAK